MGTNQAVVVEETPAPAQPAPYSPEELKRKLLAVFLESRVMVTKPRESARFIAYRLRPEVVVKLLKAVGYEYASPRTAYQFLVIELENNPQLLGTIRPDEVDIESMDFCHFLCQFVVPEDVDDIGLP